MYYTKQLINKKINYIFNTKITVQNIIINIIQNGQLKQNILVTF